MALTSGATSTTSSHPGQGHAHLVKQVIRILLTYRWTWISVTALVLVVATAAVFTITPQYTAECLVMIEPGKLNITDFKEVYDPTMTQSGVGDVRREFMATQFHLMLSEPVLEKVFLRFGFGEQERFREMSDPLEAFRDCFRVEPIRRTRLAKVTFEWEDPEMAARALSHLVKTYIEDYRRRRLGITAEGLEALKAKAADLRPRVEKRAQALQQFMAKHNMVSLEDNQDIVKERLKEISTNLTAVEAERIQLESRYRNIQEAAAGKRPLDDLPEVNNNPVIRDLKLELVKVNQEIENFGERFGSNHPEMRRMNARRAVLKGRLDDEINGILASAEADFDRIRRQEEELRRALSLQEKKVMDQNRMAVEYNLLKDSHESTNASYRSIIKRIEEIEIASAAGTKEDNVFEITPPKVPTEASFPRKKRSLALAALVGLILGWSLSFLLHSLDGSVKSTEDVEDELGLPVLGHVPRSARGNSGPNGADLYSLENPRGSFAESFRSLQTSIALARAGDPIRRLLVTSATPSEGKDLVCVNTAIAIARNGKRVLLIDADMRRPRQHKVFGVSSRSGLSNLLAGRGDAGPLERVRPTVVPGVSLLPAGPIPPDPMELVASDRMREVLDLLEPHFDVLVLNSPPVMAVSDPVVLSRIADGTLLVVRALVTRREAARRALEILKRADARLLGAVLNLVDVPRTGSSYYGAGYHAYEDYCSPDSEVNPDPDLERRPAARTPSSNRSRVARVRLEGGEPVTEEAVFES